MVNVTKLNIHTFLQRLWKYYCECNSTVNKKNVYIITIHAHKENYFASTKFAPTKT